MKARHELQSGCEHPKAEYFAPFVVAGVSFKSLKERETTKDYAVDVEHLHCPRCGMFFSREILATRVFFKKDGAA